MSDWAVAIQSGSVLVAAAVGYGGSYLTQQASDRRKANAEREQLDEERSKQRAERIHDSQLQVLTALPEAVRAFIRDITLIVNGDTKTVRERGTLFQVGEENNSNTFDHNIALAQLTIQVLDDELRHELDRLRDAANSMTMPPASWRDLSQDQLVAVFERRFAELAQIVPPVNELLGRKLREELAR